MCTLPYQDIRSRCIVPPVVAHLCKPLVEPYAEQERSHGMTYGCGPCGYDVRIAQDLVTVPGKMVLASIIEKLNMPDDLEANVCDKSTWARRGLFVQNTQIEPGWFGFLTLEITSTEVIHLKYGMPIAQIVFRTLCNPTQFPYRGKYQNQAAEPQPALLEE